MSTKKIAHKYCMFGTKYPIMCAPMNQVNDLNLALAVYNAGCLPSFFENNLEDAFKFKEITNSNNFNVFYAVHRSIERLKILIELDPKFITTSGVTHALDEKMSQLFFTYAKNKNIQLLGRKTFPKDLLLKYYTAIVLKGNESAGMYAGNESIVDQVNEYDIDLPFIVSGGITSSKELDWALQKGAAAVQIGTGFAMCEESCLHKNVKQKIINEKIITTTKFEYHNEIRNRNSFEISAIENEKDSDDDNNRTNSLRMGIQDKGGHVYIGKGIKNINTVTTVKTFVDNLVNESSVLSV